MAGRNTLYEPEYVEQARKLCQLGATDIEVADFFEVSARTLYTWQAQHPELADAMKVGKEPADDRTERSLYHRANGYTYDSEEIRLIDVTREEPGPTPDAPKTLVHTKEVLRVPIRMHVPPSDTAIIFWLKNRRPGLWRDIKAVAVSGDADGAPVRVVSRIERVVVRANAADSDG